MVHVVSTLPAPCSIPRNRCWHALLCAAELAGFLLAGAGRLLLLLRVLGL